MNRVSFPCFISFTNADPILPGHTIQNKSIVTHLNGVKYVYPYFTYSMRYPRYLAIFHQSHLLHTSCIQLKSSKSLTPNESVWMNASSGRFFGVRQIHTQIAYLFHMQYIGAIVVDNIRYATELHEECEEKCEWTYEWDRKWEWKNRRGWGGLD